MIDTLEIFRYLIVGALVTVADMLIYFALTSPATRMQRIPANVLSVTCGMILGFTLHFTLVFQPHDPLVAERLAKYVIVVGISVYGVQNAVIYALAELWRTPVRLAQCVTKTFHKYCVHFVAAPVKARAEQHVTKSLLPLFSYFDDFIDRMTGKSAAALVGVIWNFVFFKFFVYA